jgi:hypothetical protein
MRREFSYSKTERGTCDRRTAEYYEGECNSAKPEDWPDDECTDNKGQEFDINPGPADNVIWTECHPNDD